jgi:hypothetical protein
MMLISSHFSSSGLDNILEEEETRDTSVFTKINLRGPTVSPWKPLYAN